MTNAIPDSNEDEQEGFLRCPTCGNRFEAPPRGPATAGVSIDLSFSHIPKILPGCLHTICQSCAEEAFQRSEAPSEVRCPVCRVTTTGLASTNSLTNSIIALQDVQRWSSCCYFCDDRNAEASHRCFECESLLCALHAKTHARSRETKEHKPIPLDARGVNAATTAKKGGHHVPVFCRRHNGVPAKLFCSKPCGTLVCHDCGVTEHSGHTIYLADSKEAEVIHRAGLTQQVVNLGHRLAAVQGAIEAVEAVKTGVERSTRMAEKTAVQTFSKLRRAVDFREKATLKNLRGVRASKAQELNAHLEILGQAMRSYTAALKTTGECLDNLEGDQLLAMEPDLRSCLEKHEGDFPSLKLEPYVDDRVEFAYDRDVAYALRLGISKIGYLAPIDTDAQDAPDKRVKVAHLVPRDVHFTLAAIMGRKRPDDVAFETPSDTVVVEMRNGSEQNFLKTGVEGPVVGRVILRTQLKGANFLAYESENFFESLSQRNATALRKEPPCDNGIPTVRFTKTLRVTGRRGERSKSMRSQSMSRISRSTRREVLRHSHYY